MMSDGPTSDLELTTDVFVATNDVTASHQHQASAVSTIRQNVLVIIYVIIGVTGFLGNMFVVGVLMSSRQLRKKVTNVYLINQGVLDALASFLVATFALTASDGSGLSGYRDDLHCRLWLTRFPVWSTVMNSTYGLLVITVDRYFRIVHPVLYKNHFTKRKLVALLVFTWLFGPLYNISWKWPTSGIVDGQCLAFSIWPDAVTASVVGIVTVTLQYVLPLITLIFCYTRIILAIRSRIKVANNTAEPTSNNTGPAPAQDKARTQNKTRVQAKPDNFTKAKKNIIKTLITVAVCFVLCWTWNEVFIFLYFVGYPTDFGGGFYHFTVVAVFSNSCINPFVYCAQYDDFRTAFKQLFLKRAQEDTTNGTMVIDLKD